MSLSLVMTKLRDVMLESLFENIKRSSCFLSSDFRKYKTATECNCQSLPFIWRHLWLLRHLGVCIKYPTSIKESKWWKK